MTPRARTSGLEVVEQLDGLLIRDTASQSEHSLHPLTAFVWRHADGQRTVAELAERATVALDFAVTDDQVWAAIDVLTGAQLMEQRVAPPAGAQRVGRRDLMRNVAAGSVAAAAMGVLAVRDSGAQTSETQKKASQEAEQKKTAAESADKRFDAIERRVEERLGKRSEESETKFEARIAREEKQKNHSEHESKARDPFKPLTLDAVWGSIAGFQPAAFVRSGNTVSLSGMVEYLGSDLDDYGDDDYDDGFVEPPDPSRPGGPGAAESCGDGGQDGSPPAPIHEDDFELEGILIGMLPQGMWPRFTQVFSVSSDNLSGNSEVHVTPNGDILLVLEDEDEDENPNDTAKQPGCDDNSNTNRAAALRRRLRRRRRSLRQRRMRLRRRARRARRRCGRMVRLKGPSEMTLSGITFTVAPLVASDPDNGDTVAQAEQNIKTRYAQEQTQKSQESSAKHADIEQRRIAEDARKLRAVDEEQRRKNPPMNVSPNLVTPRRIR